MRSSRLQHEGWVASVARHRRIASVETIQALSKSHRCRDPWATNFAARVFHSEKMRLRNLSSEYHSCHSKNPSILLFPIVGPMLVSLVVSFSRPFGPDLGGLLDLAKPQQAILQLACMAWRRRYC